MLTKPKKKRTFTRSATKIQFIKYFLRKRNIKRIIILASSYGAQPFDKEIEPEESNDENIARDQWNAPNNIASEALGQWFFFKLGIEKEVSKYQASEKLKFCVCLDVFKSFIIWLA